jgi:N-methylhydantoinase A/oxoprolinase/acetone carboxylase beta subunit
VVPRYPGVLCASGLLSANIEHEASGAYIRKFVDADPGDVVRACEALAKECAGRMQVEGVAAGRVETAFYADVCYVGQAHHIEVPFETADPARLVETIYERFCEMHDQVYGHHTRSPARFVNLRAVQRAANKVAAPARRGQSSVAARKGTRKILLGGADEFVAAEVYDRDGLAPGQVLHGPAIVEQSDTTTLIEPGWRAQVTENEVLIITRAT